MAQLNFYAKVLAFDDQVASSSPARKSVDWTRSMPGMPKRGGQQPYTLLPGEVRRIFDGSRSTSLDNTTQLTLTNSATDSSRYRFTWTSGTAPAFRTDRGLTLSGQTITIAVNNNGTVSLGSSTPGAFSAVQISDIVFVPGVSTGDASGPFDERNTGQWVVLAKDGTNTTLQLRRLPTDDFVAYGQAVLLVSNTNLQAWSAAGVQAGDAVQISAGFSTPVLKTFIIDVVTSKWFEVISTGTLPITQIGTPTTSGILFYSNAKTFLWVEMDQEGSVRCNGTTDDRDTVSPQVPGDPEWPGVFIKTGPTWTLDLVNRSEVPLKALVISAE